MLLESLERNYNLFLPLAFWLVLDRVVALQVGSYFFLLMHEDQSNIVRIHLTER